MLGASAPRLRRVLLRSQLLAPSNPGLNTALSRPGQLLIINGFCFQRHLKTSVSLSVSLSPRWMENVISGACYDHPTPSCKAEHSQHESHGLPGSQRSWREGLAPREASCRGTTDRGVGRLVAAFGWQFASRTMASVMRSSSVRLFLYSAGIRPAMVAAIRSEFISRSQTAACVGPQPSASVTKPREPN